MLRALVFAILLTALLILAIYKLLSRMERKSRMKLIGFSARQCAAIVLSLVAAAVSLTTISAFLGGVHI